MSVPPAEYWNGGPVTIVHTDSNGDSHDLTPYWEKNTLYVLDSINSDENRCTFTLINPPGEIWYGETIQVYQNGVPLFGGKLVQRPTIEYVNGIEFHHVDCPGWSRLLYRIKVRDLTNGGPKKYTSTNDVAVMQDLIDTYCPGFTRVKVKTGSTVTIDYLSLFCSVPEAFERVRNYSGKYWQVDPLRDIEYYSKSQKALVAANVFPCGDIMPYYKDLEHSHGDIRRLKNRVIIRAIQQSTATRIDYFYLRRMVPTNDPNVLQLGYRPIYGTVSINRTNPTPLQSYTLGYDPMPSVPSADLYINCDNGKIKEGANSFWKGLTYPSGLEMTIAVHYKYRQPIEMVRQDTASQAIIAAKEGDSGVYDAIEYHREMISKDGALNLADNILSNEADPDENGMVTVWYPNVRAGWIMNLGVAERGIDDQFVVQQIETTSLGDGIPGRLEHRITYGKRYHLPSFYQLWRGLSRRVDTIARLPEHTWALTS